MEYAVRTTVCMTRCAFGASQKGLYILLSRNLFYNVADFYLTFSVINFKWPVLHSDVCVCVCVTWKFSLGGDLHFDVLIQWLVSVYSSSSQTLRTSAWNSNFLSKSAEAWTCSIWSSHTRYIYKFYFEISLRCIILQNWYMISTDTIMKIFKICIFSF